MKVPRVSLLLVRAISAKDSAGYGESHPRAMHPADGRDHWHRSQGVMVVMTSTSHTTARKKRFTPHL